MSPTSLDPQRQKQLCHAFPVSDRARSACGLINSLLAQPQCICVYIWNLVVRASATSAFVIWSRFYAGAFSPQTDLCGLTSPLGNRPVAAQNPNVCTKHSHNDFCHPLINKQTKESPTATNSLKNGFFWITSVTADQIPFIFSRRTKGERCCKFYASCSCVHAVKRLKEIFHIPVSVIILPTIPNLIPGLGWGEVTFRKHGQDGENYFGQEINQCIWAWAVMPKLIYCNKWFCENVLVNTASFTIWGVVVSLNDRKEGMSISWVSGGSSIGSDHLGCLTLILRCSRDIPGKQFGITFLIVVNGLLCRQAIERKMHWDIKIQNLSVTWLLSIAESYVVLVSISLYEVQKR